jgi:alkylhydroperoxidase/carboxymuconolactone decarboxylase family protein YurZ
MYSTNHRRLLLAARHAGASSVVLCELERLVGETPVGLWPPVGDRASGIPRALVGVQLDFAEALEQRRRRYSGRARVHSSATVLGREKGIEMASIRLIGEDEATGKVKALYEEIKSQHGIDFVPNLYKAMAANPDYLEANWRRVKAIMANEGKLDRLTKEIIAVAVSAVNACGY